MTGAKPPLGGVLSVEDKALWKKKHKKKNDVEEGETERPAQRRTGHACLEDDVSCRPLRGDQNIKKEGIGPKRRASAKRMQKKNLPGNSLGCT